MESFKRAALSHSVTYSILTDLTVSHVMNLPGLSIAEQLVGLSQTMCSPTKMRFSGYTLVISRVDCYWKEDLLYTLLFIITGIQM